MGFEGKDDALAATAAASTDGAATAHASRFAAVLVQYSKKAPAQVFELALAGLSPLALRALSRLPRVGTHPVIRAIGKDDGLGFTFAFKVDASEVAAHALPAMLERWDAKYETARLKAFPPPAVETVQPLKPRNPYARKVEGGHDGEDGGEEEGSRGRGRETFVENLSVVNAAIASYDAQVMRKAIHVVQAEPETPIDPVLDADSQSQMQAAPVVAGQQLEQATLDLGLGTGEPGDAWVDLAPLYIEVPGMEAQAGGAPQFVDAAGKCWSGWVALSFEVAGPGVFAIKASRLDTAQMPLAREQHAQAAAIQRAVAARVKTAAESLTQPLRAKTRAMSAAARRNLGSSVLSQARQVLEMLEDLLLQMQLSASAEQRLALHALGMPSWAIDVRQALAAGADCYGAYLAASSPLEALDFVDRWCAPMQALQLTEQMGLFAEPAALRLQAQLQRLVGLAKAWTGGKRRSTHDECARVLAVWIDMIRAGGTPLPAPEKK